MYKLYRIVVLGIVCLLAACASDPNDELPESKAFKFPQEADNERNSVSVSFAQHLANTDYGMVVMADDGTPAKVRLGEKYYSATGNVCRRFKSEGQDEAEQVACFIRNSWKKVRSIMSQFPAG